MSLCQKISLFSAFLSGILLPLNVEGKIEISEVIGSGYVVKTGNYKVIIGKDGNIVSLELEGKECLFNGGEHGVSGGALASPDEHAGTGWKMTIASFSKVEKTGENEIFVSSPERSINYKFLPEMIEMAILNEDVPPHEYIFALNSPFSSIMDRESGREISLPNNYIEITPQLFFKNGENILLPHGTFWYIDRNSPVKNPYSPHLHAIWIGKTYGKPKILQIILHAKPDLKDSFWGALIPGRTDHIFRKGESIVFDLECQLKYPGITFDGEAELKVLDYFTGKEMLKDTKPIKIEEKGSDRINWTFSTLPPGFYKAELIMKSGSEKILERKFVLVSNVEELPVIARPSDFGKFWEETLKEQEKIPADVKLTLIKEDGKAKLYKISFAGLKGRRFYGWIAVPKKEGKYLARLFLPPSGVNPILPPPLSSDEINMAMAIHGFDVDLNQYPNFNYFVDGINSKETYYYRFVYAACSRAVDILANMPEVDPDKIMVWGGSQGGGLSFITGALNSKVKMVCATSPGLFGIEWKLKYYNQMWPPILTPGNNVEELAKIMAYFDAANFASQIRCPVLLNIGLQDFVTSPVGVISAWNSIPQDTIKRLYADPWAGHNGPDGGQRLISEWQVALRNGTTRKLAQGILFK